MPQVSPFYVKSGFWTALATTATTVSAYLEGGMNLEATTAALVATWGAFISAKTMRKSTTIESE